MKNKIKRIINLIILIAVAIGVYILAKNIPSFLIAKGNISNNNKIQTIQKVEETEETMPSGAAFEVNHSNFRKIQFGDGTYYTVDAPYIASQIYCANKGLHMNPSGEAYETIVEYVNEAKRMMTYHIARHKDCANPRSNTI